MRKPSKDPDSARCSKTSMVACSTRLGGHPFPERELRGRGPSDQAQSRFAQPRTRPRACALRRTLKRVWSAACIWDFRLRRRPLVPLTGCDLPGLRRPEEVDRCSDRSTIPPMSGAIWSERRSDVSIRKRRRSSRMAQLSSTAGFDLLTVGSSGGRGAARSGSRAGSPIFGRSSTVRLGMRGCRMRSWRADWQQRSLTG
jgi:hypothetical protein